MMQNVFARARSDDQNSLVEGYERRNGTSGRNRRYSKAMETRFLHVVADRGAFLDDLYIHVLTYEYKVEILESVFIQHLCFFY